MQPHLETEELKFLADILLEQDQGKYADLVDKVLALDLRLDGDELEQTAELLAAEKCRPKKRDRSANHILSQRGTRAPLGSAQAGAGAS